MKITNLERCNLYGVTPDWIGVLIFINSNTTKAIHIHEMLDSYLPNYIDKLKELDWVEFVKGGKTDSQKIRLNDKGKAFLKSMSEAPISNVAMNTWELLDRYYKKYELDDKVVNKTKTTFYINEFLNYKESEGKVYDLKMMEAIIKAYLISFEDGELKYAKKTLNLFYDNKNAFAKKWSVEDCPIYDFINKNGKFIASVYGKI